MLITGDSETKLSKLKAFLDRNFTIKDLKYAKFFLGLEIMRSVDGIYVNKQKYVLDLIQYAGLIGNKTASTPLRKGHKLNVKDGELLLDPQPYKRLVGRLLYLSYTSPDIGFVTQQLSQFVQAPRQEFPPCAKIFKELTFVGHFISFHKINET